MKKPSAFVKERNFQQPFLRPKELAHFLNVSLSSLKQLRIQGQGIPYYKVQKGIRYDLDDVEAYLQAARRYSTSEEFHG